MKHLLGIEHLNGLMIHNILDRAKDIKAGNIPNNGCLKGQTWALLFSKPSTRTRITFEVGIRQLGGNCIYLSLDDTQWGRGELIKDTARVLGRIVQGAILRTHAQQDIESFAEHSQIPTINGLSNTEHPCQILADLLTMRELKGSIAPLRVVFIGDGKCNTATSLIWACGKLHFHLSVIAPKAYQPNGTWRAWENMLITDELDAVAGADVLYTDTFVSMGTEQHEALRLADLGPYWINDKLVAKAKPDCIVMHPLPAHRGQEIQTEVFELHAGTIFQQSENRLHVQKAVLSML